MWTGDVGQNAYEEIDIVENGGNYGWDCREGMHDFRDPAPVCSERSGFIEPVWEYERSLGVSVTGGFVYRGPTLDELTGKYVYADYASGRIWSLEVSDNEDPVNTQLYRTEFGISSFGVDADNELYICGFDGNIHKLVKEE